MNKAIPSAREDSKVTNKLSKTFKQTDKKIVVVKSSPPKPITRTNFPETWLWMQESINSSGKKDIEIKVPDTITTWYANGFAISPIDGIGVASPVSLRTFQPMFVSLALPYSVIRGESLKVPATVFNYYTECFVVQINLEYSNSDSLKSLSSPKMCVCESKSVTYKFKVTPDKLGHMDVTARAKVLESDSSICPSHKTATNSVIAADAMTRKLLVEAEGIKKQFSLNSFFCPRDHGGFYNETLVLNVPQPIVKGSVYAELSVVGDLMGPSMDNLDKLLAMPYGCGEQNMIKFAPNIYVMDYLVATNQLNSKIETKAKEFMRSGYQRELTYKHSSGAYSAFGQRDKEGSTWLTAFVLKAYSQAQRYIFIDRNDIEDSKRWLLSLQDTSGCFKDVGMVHHKEMKGGITSGITMTAFVLNALLEAEMSHEDRRIQKALTCITKGLDNVSDPYTASILAYTLSLAGSDKRTEMLNKLNDLSVKTDGLMHWEKPHVALKKKSGHPSAYYHYQAPSADIEMTGYALMSFIGGRTKFGSPLDHLQIVKWLVKQRNSNGGFSSTQDTCVALQALSQYSATAFGGDYSLNIIASGTGFFKQFQITNDNKMVLQRAQIPTIPTNININADGNGCLLVQADVKYNKPKPVEDPSFYLYIHMQDVHTLSCKHIMRVCASYPGGQSNMALIDVTMVSGFEPIMFELDLMMQSKNVAFSMYEFEDGVLSFYFDNFEKFSTCVEFPIEQVAEVIDRKAAPVKVYDYYDTAQSNTKMYSVVGVCPETNVA